MSDELGNEYKEYITEVPDFPKPGIGFKDISPLLADEQTFRSAIVDMGMCVDAGYNCPDYWIGIDARGFIFASALAIYFGGGVTMIRKKGKLPPPTIDTQYNTEYSMDFVSIKKGEGKVVIVDDVLATGGTLKATNELAEKAGYNIIGNLVLVDLKYVPRVDNFNLNIDSVITYE